MAVTAAMALMVSRTCFFPHKSIKPGQAGRFITTILRVNESQFKQVPAPYPLDFRMMLQMLNREPELEWHRSWRRSAAR
jgi:hypothetical protein